MQSENTKQHVLHQLSAYPHLFELFKTGIPQSPQLTVKVYVDPKIDQTWGQRFTFWSVLLHDSDPQFNALLRELDSLVAKSNATYGEKRLRNGIKSNPFSFISELIAYEAFQSNGIGVDIEPSPAQGSRKKMDFAVSLDNRKIMVEVIAPFPREKMIKQGAGFGPMDSGLSEKLAHEIAAHLEGMGQPINPVIIMVDGVYSAVDPINAEASIAILNSHAPALAVFVSAVLVFRSNWGNSIWANPSGPQLTKKEIALLHKIFRIPG